MRKSGTGDVGDVAISVLDDRRPGRSRPVGAGDDPQLVRIIRDGGRLTAREYMGALAAASAFYYQLRPVFADYEFILSPVLACEPFEIGIEGPTEINGKPCHPIVGWLLTYPF